MIDDLALLKQAMEQMDAEDPTVAQAAKDRAAQTLSDAKLSFAKMAELIEQRRLLLQPRIVARIKRMDQPGMLGDAAFRDASSALRKEGQSFGQIAEAIERTGRLAPPYEDMAPDSEPLYQMASEPGASAWPRALGLIAPIVLFPLRHPIRLLAIALLAILLFYALRGVVSLGQQVSGYFDGVAAVRDGADKAISSVSSFVHEHISRQSKEAAAPPAPPSPIPSPPAVAPSPPPLSPPSAAPSAAPATASAPLATAPAPSATAPAPSAGAPTPSATAPVPSASASAPPGPPSAAPAPTSPAPAGPTVSTPRRDARGGRLSKSAANHGAAPEDCYPQSRRYAPSEDNPPRALEDMIPEGMRRSSRVAGPCIGGIGGCYWGGGRY